MNDIICRYCHKPIEGIDPLAINKPNIHNECFWEKAKKEWKTASNQTMDNSNA